MFHFESNAQNKKHFYQELESFAFSLISGEKNLVANLANLSSLFFHSLPDLNWSGFYLWTESDQELVLGPFQGKPACIRIKAGKGVCGTAYKEKKTMLVKDVEEFPGHIACDSASRSELVIPLTKNGQVLGVLDLDSPTVNRFTQEDADALSALMQKLSAELF